MNFREAEKEKERERERERKKKRRRKGIEACKERERFTDIKQMKNGRDLGNE